MLEINQFFKEFIQKSLGCTEPAAIGLAVAIAYNALKGDLPEWVVKTELKLRGRESDIIDNYEEISKIIVRIDKDTYRNALEVIIPNTSGLKGVQNAAALGLFCNPVNSLELFQDLTEETISKSQNLIKKDIVKIIPEYEWETMQIIAEIHLNRTVGIAQINGEHTNIVKIQVNDRVVYKKDLEESKIASHLNKLVKLEIKDLLSIVKNLTLETKNLLEESLNVNYVAYKKALEEFKTKKEKSVGIAIKELIEEEYLSKDLITFVKYVVTTAVEGRMAGFPIEVMTCAGSGNMGLMVTISLKIISDWFKKEKSKLLGSLALAHLLANYISIYSGHLSALCGCNIKAGVGLTAGISYLLVEDAINEEKVIEIVGSAINNSIADITGIICDGAKRTCSFKVATAVDSAITCALLALKGIKHSHNQGIINKNPLVSIKNIEVVSKGMIDTDKLLIKEILEKK